MYSVYRKAFGSKKRKAFLIRVLLAIIFSMSIRLPVDAAASGVIPNDPYWERQWYVRQVHAPEAWEMATGTRSVVVAILDGGVDITHPDLSMNVWTNPLENGQDKEDNDRDGFMDDIHGWNFVNDTNDVGPMAAVGDQSEETWSHGTFVASLIGASGNNGMGMTGMNWKVQLMPLVVLDGDGFGNIPNVVRAIRYAIQKHVDVINLSLSGTEYSPELEQAIKDAYQVGIFVVSATGNDGYDEGANLDERPSYPACMDGGINAMFGVGGTDTLDQKAPHANYGRLCTDLVAPAQEFFGARPSYRRSSDKATTTANYLDGMTGTSLAAPLVSGAAALLKSVRPDLTAHEIGDALRYSADPIEDNLLISERGRMGAGRLNVARALARVAPETAHRTKTPYTIEYPKGIVLFSAQLENGRRLWTEAGEARLATWESTTTHPEARLLLVTPTTWTQKTWDPVANHVTSTVLWQASSKLIAPVQAATSSKVIALIPASNTVAVIDTMKKARSVVTLPKLFGRKVTKMVWNPTRRLWVLTSPKRREVAINEEGKIVTGSLR